MLLDLMGDTEQRSTTGLGTVNGQQNTADLLADILGTSNGDTLPNNSSNAVSAQTNSDSILSLFGQSAPVKSVAPASTGPLANPVYNKNDLSVTMQVTKTSATIQALAKFRNTSNFERFGDVGLQAAVPKSLKLTLQAMNKPNLGAGDEGAQG